MVTLNQLSSKKRTRIERLTKFKAPAFNGAPHRKGIIYKITTMSPRKPNSARRTFAKVRLIFNEKKIFAKFLV
jgi:small subunit ribosomal protein S12